MLEPMARVKYDIYIYIDIIIAPYSIVARSHTLSSHGIHASDASNNADLVHAKW
jgi:hypothetical protein